MINIRQAKRYCKEDLAKIENYDKAIADTTQTWDLHHRTEIWWNCSKKELIENECYYHRKACELIFLTSADHISLHKKGKTSPNKGNTLSKEIRKKMSDSHKGHKSALKGNTTSIFGKAFKEHYGITRCNDIKLYNKEYSFYKYYGHFSWEVM